MIATKRIPKRFLKLEILINLYLGLLESILIRGMRNLIKASDRNLEKDESIMRGNESGRPNETSEESESHLKHACRNAHFSPFGSGSFRDNQDGEGCFFNNRSLELVSLLLPRTFKLSQDQDSFSGR